MKAEVRRFHSPDVHDLQSWTPPRSDSFALLLQVFIGSVGEKGEDTFDILVCSPKWLDETLSDDAIEIGRHYLLLKEYNFPKIEQFIKSYADACSGDTWEEIGEKLARLGKWEFEDYRESP